MSEEQNKEGDAVERKLTVSLRIPSGPGGHTSEPLQVSSCNELRDTLIERRIKRVILCSQSYSGVPSYEGDWVQAKDLADEHFNWLTADVQWELRQLLLDSSR